MGLGLIGAVMHTHIRDTAHVVSILTRAGFFLSGVFFGMRHIDEAYHETSFALNPMAVLIEMSRSTMTGDTSLLPTRMDWTHGAGVFHRPAVGKHRLCADERRKPSSTCEVKAMSVILDVTLDFPVKGGARPTSRSR